MFMFGFVELIVIVLVVVVPIALVTVLLVVASKGKNQSPPLHAEPIPNLGQRTDTLRQKQDRYREERSRILGMVDQGTISAEEADRLFETLERETTTMACPFCEGEIRAEATKCKHCRRFLVEEMVRPKRLMKSRDKMLSGVCAGAAEYMDVDPALVRILTVLVVLFSGIITGLIVYVIAALILPES